MITYGFENGACLTLRTSGTEPKIKYYLEVCHEDKNECESMNKDDCIIDCRVGRSNGEGSITSCIRKGINSSIV